MKQAKSSRSRKSVVKAPQKQEIIVDYKNIALGIQHIRAIENACRSVEAKLRAEFQNPLTDTIKYLNLAEPRLPDYAINSAIRPFFYFGVDHGKIQNQQSFQNAVRDILTDPDSIAIFNTMIRVYFQALNLHIDDKSSNKTVHAAIGPASLPRPIPRATVHSTYFWNKTDASPIHVGQLIRWNGCNFFISYGRLNPNIIEPFIRNVQNHMHLPHAEFTGIVERQLIRCLADPFDKFSRDHFSKEKTPNRRAILERIASHVLPNNVSGTIGNFVKISAQQTNLVEIKALKTKIKEAYKTVDRQERGCSPGISKSLPLPILQKILLCGSRASHQIFELGRNPLHNLLLDQTTIRATALPPDAPISAALNADEIPKLFRSIIETSWKTYVTEQRLIVILRSFRNSAILDDTPTLSLIFQLVDIRFMDTKIVVLPLEKRALHHLLNYIDAYLDYTTIDLPLDQITFSHLLNVPIDYDPIDFGGLPRATKLHFIDALIQHISEWRQTTPHVPTTKNALNALHEINQFFDV